MCPPFPAATWLENVYVWWFAGQKTLMVFIGFHCLSPSAMSFMLVISPSSEEINKSAVHHPELHKVSEKKPEQYLTFSSFVGDEVS